MVRAVHQSVHGSTTCGTTRWVYWVRSHAHLFTVLQIHVRTARCAASQCIYRSAQSFGRTTRISASCASSNWSRVCSTFPNLLSVHTPTPVAKTYGNNEQIDFICKGSLQSYTYLTIGLFVTDKGTKAPQPTLACIFFTAVFLYRALRRHWTLQSARPAPQRGIPFLSTRRS